MDHNAIYPSLDQRIVQVSCSYFYFSVEPRGEIVILIAGSSYLVVAILCYASSGLLMSSLAFATGFILLHILWSVLVAAVYRVSPLHPLAALPGPFLNKITSLKLAYVTYRGQRNAYAVEMHEKYGVVVRTGTCTQSMRASALTRC